MHAEIKGNLQNGLLRVRTAVYSNCSVRKSDLRILNALHSVSDNN